MSASDFESPLVSTTSAASRALDGLRIAFVGKLGGLTKREAQQVVRQYGGLPVDVNDPDVDLVVIGADELPLEEETLVTDEVRQAAAEGRVEILGEPQLWQRLGLDEGEQSVRLYTPAMLAHLLDVPIATIRRWHRRRLIVPIRQVQGLPYFDFQEVATARQLAKLLAAGASPAAIERKLEVLSRFVPDVERPLAQLSVIVEGQQILLRQGEGLIEPGGQLRIDFESLEGPLHEEDEPPLRTLPLEAEPAEVTPADMLDYAADYEDQGDLEAAAEMYRAALAADGPRPRVCFQLAEVLYRMGDLSAARERYYMAVELDEDYVEARANLGCVLAESGQLELAVAAFQGTLEYHGEYPDVHYHLARTLDELGRAEEATRHWRRFLQLAPDSPWSDEARSRLEL